MENKTKRNEKWNKSNWNNNSNLKLSFLKSNYFHISFPFVLFSKFSFPLPPDSSSPSSFLFISSSLFLLSVLFPFIILLEKKEN